MTNVQHKHEIEELRHRLAEAEEALHAIRDGQVDAVVVESPDGPRVFSLAGAETIYRLAVETMAESAANVTPEGTILFCNARFSELVATPQEQLLGRNVAEFVSEPAQDAFRALLGECSRQPVKQRVVFYGPNDTRTPALLSGSALIQGESVSLCLIIADLRELESSAHQIEQLRRAEAELKREIIERKQAEAELARTTETLETLLATAPLGFCHLDRELRYLRVNDRLAEMNGMPAADHLGKTVAEVMPSLVPQVQEVTNAILMSGEAVVGREFSGETSAQPGVTRHASVSWYPVRDTSGAITGFGVIVEEITARKRAEEALRKAHEQLADRAKQLETLVQLRTASLATSNEQLRKEGLERERISILLQQRTEKLEETVAELEGFSYSITHDLRAPLRAMQGFADVLEEEYGERLDDVAKNYLKRIAAAAHRMDKLIQDVLQYSRALQIDLKLEPVSVEKLLRGMIATYPDLQEPKATVTIDGELPQVLGNEAALTQCFSNLLNNAVKFVPPEIKPRVQISAKSNGDTARFWVADNGIGIAERHLDNIFGMFQRLDTKYEGTGIGLNIVRKVAERMGGRVGVESEPGKGSRFWLELKLANIESAL